MELKFNNTKQIGKKWYLVSEDGEDTEKVQFEHIGIISVYKSDPFL
ncbi:unnamed protein product, partial [marine sediment metagenome]